MGVKRRLLEASRDHLISQIPYLGPAYSTYKVAKKGFEFINFVLRPRGENESEESYRFRKAVSEGKLRANARRRQEQEANEMAPPGHTSESTADNEMQGDTPVTAESDATFKSIPGALGHGIKHVPAETFTRSRTFQHYIEFKDHNHWLQKTENNSLIYENKDWCLLPYNWLCSYMSVRDYQALNTMYSKWRIKSVEVEGHHIVPFVDETRSVGGNTNPSLELSPLSFFEAFVDMGHELPYILSDWECLPNNYMENSRTSRTNAKLKQVTMKDFNWPNDRATFELENSPGYSFVHASDGFSFSHSIHPVDQQWRHACQANDIHWKPIADNYKKSSDGFCAPVLGSSHSSTGADLISNLSDTKKVRPGMPGQQLLLQSFETHYPHSPLPTILFRVPKIEKSTGSPINYGFMLYVTYTIRFEAVPNSIAIAPMKFANPTHGVLLNDDSERYQNCGSGGHKMMKLLCSQTNTRVPNYHITN